MTIFGTTTAHVTVRAQQALDAAEIARLGECMNRMLDGIAALEAQGMLRECFGVTGTIAGTTARPTVHLTFQGARRPAL